MDTVRPANIFIQPHLGLGDALVCNAIFRHLSETHNVLIPCKFHNVPSVQFMLRGLPIALVGVNDDEGANKLAAVFEKRGEVLRLGMFGGHPWSERHWDSCMYRQAGIPFEKRWTDWKVDRDLSREFEPPREPYIFAHQDSERGFNIDFNRVPVHELPMLNPQPGRTDNIFDYCRLIENATELHLIDSCFAILADSLITLKAKRKVIHLYARPNALPPTYREGWEILR